MGFRHARSAQQALDEAIRIKGGGASIIILGMGGEIAPRPRRQ
jgi:electron transfer flavoprotein alpha/beta subunit